MMSDLDKAVEAARNEAEAESEEAEAQLAFYELFFSSILYIPTIEPAVEHDDGSFEVSPIVIENEGDDFIMLFDSEERLQEWADGEEIDYIGLPGEEVFLNFGGEGHYFMLNANSEYSKEFQPEEIDFFLDSFKAEDGEQENE